MRIRMCTFGRCEQDCEETNDETKQTFAAIVVVVVVG
jgi:hypothetical protein